MMLRRDDRINEYERVSEEATLNILNYKCIKEKKKRKIHGKKTLYEKRQLNIIIIIFIFHESDWVGPLSIYLGGPVPVGPSNQINGKK